MLSLLLALAVVGLLIALGLRCCMYLYGAGVLGYDKRRRSIAMQAPAIDSEVEEAIAETEYMANLVHSIER